MIENCYKRNYVRPITIGMLPSSYLESLTYLEQILEINKKLCEVIERLNNIDISQFEQLIDEKIKEVKTYIDNQDENLYNKIDDKLQQEILILQNLINEKVIFLIDYVKNSNNALKAQIEVELQKLKDEIEKIVIGNINIYNPTTGKYDSLQNAVDDLYRYLRYYGITANEFDMRGFTCSDFESYNLTARKFDLYSKCILLIDFVHNMYSPFNGKIESLQDIITQLAKLHQEELTCQEFDDLDLTSNEFDEKDLTAYDFDWKGKLLLTA